MISRLLCRLFGHKFGTHLYLDGSVPITIHRCVRCGEEGDDHLKEIRAPENDVLRDAPTDEDGEDT